MIDDTQDTPIEYTPEPIKCPNKPLFLPIGSVRALLALSVTTAFITICIQSGNIEALAVIATMIAKDYFNSKEA